MATKVKKTTVQIRQERMQAAIKELERQKKENLKKAHAELSGCLSVLILFIVLVLVLPAVGVLVLVV